MALWFTSDEHYGHTNIIDFCKRPFRDVQEMNDMLVGLHNRLVRPGDEVIHVGDFALGPEANVPAILKRLNGKHRLVAGNHDRCWGQKRAGLAAERRYLLYGFESVHFDLHLTLGKRHLHVQHFPLYDPTMPRIGDKYVGLRPTESDLRGAVAHVHGHVHHAWRTFGRCLNVGVDVWDYEPVSEAAVLEQVESIVAAHATKALPKR